MEFVFDNPELLWGIPGLLVVLLVAVGVARSRRTAEKTGTAEQLPTPPPEGLAVGADKLVQTPVGLRPDLAPEPIVAPPAPEPERPSTDLTPDLTVRPQGGLPEDASVAPHPIEEIQRAEPKPLASALSNTRSGFFGRLKSLFSKKEKLTAGELEDIEEILYTSDLGPQTVQRLLGAVENRLSDSGGSGFDAVRSALKEEMLEIFAGIENGAGRGNGAANGTGNGHDKSQDGAHGTVIPVDFSTGQVHHGSEAYLEGLEKLAIWDNKPAILMVVGVNGAGKTTTIGKLARRLAQSGRRVLVAAGDTFRAAAGDQLKVWTERAQVEIFAPEGVTDPSAVAFDACQTGKAQGFDVVIIDTAGRLHTQKNLMEELKKMKRVITKVIPDAPHEVLLVLDANNGQNALVQAKEFNEALDVTGVVLTKLDGTAKGGVAVGLACELGLPIKLIGVGEGIEDLRKFSSREFVDSII